MIKRIIKNRTNVCPQHTAAFTIMELLVVIAVIALLASMLLPALHGAREFARKAKCMSNLKQLGYLITMYADDYNDYLFPSYDESFTGNDRFWPQRLRIGGYVKTLPSGLNYVSKLFICPSIKDNNPDSNGNPRSSRVYGMLSASNYWKRSSRTNPSGFCLLTDSIATTTGGPWYYVNLASYSILKVDLAHSGRANILFLDGSVRSLGKSDLEKLGIINYYEH